MHVDIQPFAEYAVAPYMGAWIETVHADRLKPDSESHPTWVRGLKQGYLCALGLLLVSHPTWVRGLKHHTADEGTSDTGRTLHGCVD